MGQGSVAASSWGLDHPHDAAAQGLIVSPFSDLDASLALLLELPSACGGAWLASVSNVAPVTSAVRPPKGQGSQAPSVAIAFTWTGLQAIGLDARCRDTFSAPFVEGMRQVDRQRRLGDRAGDIAVVRDGLRWSGNAPDPAALGAAAAPTPFTVHAALLLYHRDRTSLSKLEKAVMASLRPFKVKVVRRIETQLRDDRGEIREHFGFVDGISQPIPVGKAIVTPGGSKPDPLHEVAAGDILIGHQNADTEPAPGPFISEEAPEARHLPQGHAPYGSRDLGRDGSYLVIRELHQDVKAFWDSMREAAAALGDDKCDDKWLAARVVGRTLDGDPLSPDIPRSGGEPANAFGFLKTDAAGLGCPLGSHIRRANPRDGLAPKAREGELFRHAANNHRILRRGRKFGPSYREDEPQTASPIERGLLFMALNTDIARQFEFIQQTWMLNRNFAALYDETDPLVGAQGKFTVPRSPLRARVDVKTFVQLAGGDYFFLPSLPTLRFLETLP
ncbi:MAG: Dyp-type peroxidase [Phenylobacterium sp.]